MRVGILTLMHGFNYGGMLQCAALVKALTRLGHSVEVIDFNPRWKWRLFQSVLTTLPSSMSYKIQKDVQIKRYGDELVSKFEGFRNSYLNLSPPANNRRALARIAANYDAVVVGSDQVWNLSWFTPEYFLDFGRHGDFLKISYAACFGSSDRQPAVEARAGRLVAAFDSIAVRNGFSRDQVKRLACRDAAIVADPTLLEGLHDIEEAADLNESKYILLYPMTGGRLAKVTPYLELMKARAGLKIVAIQSEVLQSWDISVADVKIKNPSVGQWLWLVRHASSVATDSFHGSILSARAGIPFINYLGDDPSALRFQDVAARYGLSSADTQGVFECNSSINFHSVNEKIDKHVKTSLDFLRSALGP